MKKLWLVYPLDITDKIPPSFTSLSVARKQAVLAAKANPGVRYAVFEAKDYCLVRSLQWHEFSDTEETNKGETQ